MAKFIKHRMNRASDLTDLLPEFGVEIDLRSNVDSTGQIHLAHDPWTKGEDFEEWLKVFSAHKFKGPLILNTKEDGLENRAVELMKNFGIQEYFFLDTTFPTNLRLTRTAERTHLSWRISTHEVFPAPGLMNLFDWVWVDCFGGQAMNPSEIKNHSGAARLCMVSPELQGALLESTYEVFISLAKSCDYICTKEPLFWKKVLRDL